MNATICALLASHDRREATLQCLRALQRSRGLPGLGLSAVLVDEGSDDGTAEAVLEEFSWVQVIRAEGSLQGWQAMHHAFAQALRESHSYYLWLGDDTLLRPDALATLVATARERRGALGHPVIVVGTAGDAAGGQPARGGRRRTARWLPASWQLLTPAALPQRVEVMDGSLVLIPAESAELVGNIDAGFGPALGDHDYALRAQGQGAQVWLAPGVLAQCGAPSARRRLPWRSWLRFTRRHAGLGWPLCFAWPYLRGLPVLPPDTAGRA